MKKTKLIMGLALCGTVLLGVSGVNALAADYPATTDGTITWEASTGPGEVVKPELPGIIIKPGGGGETSGALRIQHVPDFDFGNQEIKAGAQTFNPKFELYEFVGKLPAGATADTDYFMPHFVQVTDGRGDNTGWHLTVSATAFAKGAETLDNTKIILNGGARLSNTVYDTTEIANRVKTYTGATGTDALEIPRTGTSAERVLETKTNGIESTTNGSQTSLVLSKDYDKDDLTDTDGTLNPGVTFNKPNEDVASLGEYKSTITWTLTDGI